MQYHSKNACINTIFQRLSICILIRCLLKEMGNYLIIFTFFWWCKGALYSRNSSLWLLRSWKLTGWLKSPDICRGRRGVEGLPVQKKLRDSAEWFIFGDFLNIAIPNVDIYSICAAYVRVLWVKWEINFHHFRLTPFVCEYNNTSERKLCLTY